MRWLIRHRPLTWQLYPAYAVAWVRRQQQRDAPPAVVPRGLGKPRGTDTVPAGVVR